jgi:hypothetical protein
LKVFESNHSGLLLATLSSLVRAVAFSGLRSPFPFGNLEHGRSTRAALNCLDDKRSRAN